MGNSEILSNLWMSYCIRFEMLKYEFRRIDGLLHRLHSNPMQHNNLVVKKIDRQIRIG